MDVAFGWVDVFARTPLTGNPLPVVPDADALSTEQMRAIAQEFNQSETTFLVAPTISGADRRLRSFTPDGTEVLGAGHNAMGAWIWLAESGALPPDREEFAQQIGEDVLPVRIERDRGAARVTMRQSPPRYLDGAVDRLELDASLGLPPQAVIGAEVVSTGAEHLLVAVGTRALVDDAAPDPSRLKAVLADAGAEGCYVYATVGEDQIVAYARFFNPTVGIAEDPATGTAAGPLAALLVRDGLAPSPILIEQGSRMGRPSILEIAVDGPRVEISGSGVIVARGHLVL